MWGAISENIYKCHKLQKDNWIRISMNKFFDQNINFSRNFPKFDMNVLIKKCIFYSILKEIYRPFPPYRFLGRNIFSLSENLFLVFASFESLKGKTHNNIFLVPSFCRDFNIRRHCRVFCRLHARNTHHYFR